MDDITVRRATVDDVDKVGAPPTGCSSAPTSSTQDARRQLKAYAEASFGRDVVADLLADAATWSASPSGPSA